MSYCHIFFRLLKPRKLLCISSTALQLSPFYQTTEQLSLFSALAQSVPTFRCGPSVLVSEALDLKLKAVVSVVEPLNGQQIEDGTNIFKLI